VEGQAVQPLRGAQGARAGQGGHVCFGQSAGLQTGGEGQFLAGQGGQGLQLSAPGQIGLRDRLVWTLVSTLKKCSRLRSSQEIPSFLMIS